MKLKITIAGQKVHDVGYRVFLGKLAMSLALPGFMAYNWDDKGYQQVIAFAEGDEARMAVLRRRIEEKKPELADVYAITFDEYDGNVGHTSEYAMLLSFEQFDKAIPILQGIKDSTDKIKENTDMIPRISDDIKEMKGDIKEMKGDIKTVKKNTDPIPQLVEEIQPGYAMQFRQVQTEIRAIKDRLGMP